VYRDFLPFRVNEWGKADFVAYGSYRSVDIMGDILKLREFLTVANTRKYDVIPLVFNNRMLIPQATEGHSADFLVAWEAMLTSMGFNHSYIRQFDNVPAFYRNSYIVQPYLMKEIIGFMNRAIEAALHNESVVAVLKTDAGYMAGTPGVAEKAFDTPYYQWHPFVFERLPIFYFNHIKAAIHLPKPIY
jgi:hypothetical protein